MGNDLTSRSKHARGCGIRKYGQLTDSQRDDLRALQALTGEAKDTIERLLTCGSYRVELAAAQEILDRAFGRSEKIGTVQVNHSQGPALGAAQSPDDQEAMLVAALAAVRARRADDALVVEMTPHEVEGTSSEAE